MEKRNRRAGAANQHSPRVLEHDYMLSALRSKVHQPVPAYSILRLHTIRIPMIKVATYLGRSIRGAPTQCMSRGREIVRTPETKPGLISNPSVY